MRVIHSKHFILTNGASVLIHITLRYITYFLQGGVNIEQKEWSSNSFFWADVIQICISKQHGITSHGILHSPKHSLHLTLS